MVMAPPELAPPPRYAMRTDFQPLAGTPQADILAASRDPSIKLIIAESGVGGGKTVIESFVALSWAFEIPGSHGFLIGPDYQMLTVQRDELEARLDEVARCNGLTRRDLVRVNKLERRYNLFNGSVIWLKSATDPEKFRNYSLDWAVLGEAQKYSERVHTIARTRMRASRIGRVMITATVSGRNWIADLREQIAKDDDASAACFLWQSADNPMLSAEELEYAETHLPEDVWRREYLADRTAGGAMLFENLDELVGGEHKMAGARCGVCIGVDFGQKRDFTVIAALDLATDTVIEMDRFQHVPYAGEGGVYDRIRTAWLRYGKPRVMVDTGGAFGQSHADVLQRDYGIASIKGLSTGNRRRSPPVEHLIRAFERRAIRIPKLVKLADGQTRELPADVFHREARELIAEARSGYTRYTHPPGGHDDTIIAVALAWTARSESAKPINLTRWRPLGGRGAFKRRF